MACERVQLPGGAAAIVCGGRRRQRCIHCHGPADRLCDFPRAAARKTCDAPLCSSCATRPEGTELDYCRPHAARRT